MPVAKPDQVHALAQAYEPMLVFSSGERVFPVLVESHLSHVSSAAWAPGASQPAVRDLGVPAESNTGPNRRGTAIMDRIAPGTRLGGPNAAGAPLRRDGSGPDAIGSSAYRGQRASQDLFLTFGGWSNNLYTSGNSDYVVAAFAELSAAMEPGAVATPPGRGVPAATRCPMFTGNAPSLTAGRGRPARRGRHAHHRRHQPE
jgi:hypothetical protein